MEDKRRLSVLLAILVVVAAAAIYMQSGPAVPASGGPGGGAAPASAVAPGVTAPDVHTESLASGRPAPEDNARDLFTFKPKYVPPPARPAVAPARTSGAVLVPAVPQVPPIALKFIGVLEPPAGGRIAILSDGRGAPIYGKEGDTLLGQYRVVRIGTESIEMEHLDGRGRQTIRLSGA